MKTIKDVFTEYKEGLTKLYGKEETEAITLLTVAEISGFTKAKIKAFPEFELTEEQSGELAGILSQLKTGKPIQYILGKTEFYGLPFFVNPSVLIPRPETEELVEWVIESVGSRQWAVDSCKQLTDKVEFAGCRILDIGTGSGCIAITLKKHLPNFEVLAIDISADALQIAMKNSELNEVNINFINADILTLQSLPTSPISNLQSPISIIISNPPYVTLHDKTQMHTNVTDFEPHTALFVPEDDPLIFYKAIASFAKTNLVPNGLLFFEINESYGNEVVCLLNEHGFSSFELRKDMSGRDRMVKCLKQDL